MSKLIDKRKRSREDDVLCESTPLSKRINNLHLTNFEEAQAHMNENVALLMHNKELMHNSMLQLPSGMETDHCMSTNDLRDSISALPAESLYNPELDETQNPFYYLKNKLLHDLHLERMKRCYNNFLEFNFCSGGDAWKCVNKNCIECHSG